MALKVLFDEAMMKQKKNDSLKRASTNNQTGFKWLTKTKNARYKGGHAWRYQKVVHGERVVITATDLYRLFDKVRSRGYPWIIVDMDRAQRAVENESLVFEDFLKYMECNGGYVDYTEGFKLVVSQ